MTHPKLHASLSELDAWTIDEMLDAHLLLDALDEAEQKARKSK